VRHLPRGQGHGLVQQVGVAQAAQTKAHAVTACTAAKTGAQVGPGFTDLVFIHGLGVGALSLRLSAGAIGHLPRHDRGQAGLRHRVASAARVDVDLHIDHGDGVALHQKHARAAGLGPVLNGQSSLRPAGGGPTDQSEGRSPPSLGVQRS